MKKYIFMFIIIMIVGCKNNTEDKLVCSYKDNDKEHKVTIYFKNNESVNYEKVTNMLFDDIRQASNYKLDDNYDSIEVVDKKVSMYVSENIDDMTKEEIISLYKKSGYVCK